MKTLISLLLLSLGLSAQSLGQGIRLGDPAKQVQGTLAPVNGGLGLSAACANNELPLSNGTAYVCTLVTNHNHTKSQVSDFAHASTHQHGGNDEVANATPGTANAILKVNSSGFVAGGWLSDPLELLRSSVDATPFNLRFVKSRGGASVSVNDVVGGLQYRMFNSTPAEVDAGSVRVVALDPTATSEDAEFHFLTNVAGVFDTTLSISSSPRLFDRGTRPSCASTDSGRLWYDEGGVGVADTFAICKKNAADAYNWDSGLVDVTANYDWTGLHTLTGTPDGLSGTGRRPFEVFSVNSDRTGATSENQRLGTLALYCNDVDEIDNGCLVIDQINTTDPSAGVDPYRRTGIHVKSYTLDCPSGGECSGILGVSTGGGPAITAYKVSETLRPSGFTNRASSTQPALEVGTADQAAAGLFVSGAFGSANVGQSIHARIGNAGSKGILINSSDGVFDNRKAIQIGTHVVGAANTGLTFDVELDGGTTWNLGTSTLVVDNNAQKFTRSSADNAGPSYTVFKNRSGGAALANDVVGSYNYHFSNSSGVETQAGIIRGTVLDPTAASEDFRLSISTIVAGVLADSFFIDDAPQWKDRGTKPTCSVTQRGKVWYDAGGAGVKDTFEVCAKDAADVYDWRVLY